MFTGWKSCDGMSFRDVLWAQCCWLDLYTFPTGTQTFPDPSIRERLSQAETSGGQSNTEKHLLSAMAVNTEIDTEKHLLSAMAVNTEHLHAKFGDEFYFRDPGGAGYLKEF